MVNCVHIDKKERDFFHASVIWEITLILFEFAFMSSFSVSDTAYAIRITQPHGNCTLLVAAAENTNFLPGVYYMYATYTP